MAIAKTLATGMLGRSASRRLSRVIPNPVVRYLTLAAATTLVPMIARKVRSRLQSKRLAKAESSVRYPAVSAG